MHCLYQPQVTQGVRAGPQATKGWQGSDRSRGSLSSVPDNVVTAKDPYTSTAPKYVVPIWSDMNEVDPLHDPDPIREKQWICTIGQRATWNGITLKQLLLQEGTLSSRCSKRRTTTLISNQE